MGFTSLQVVMDSADWFQGTIHEDSGMDSSSPSGDILTCSRPIMERRLRPQQDQALKCPRCESTHTKFCYYNNYSLSQPRYFCKTCRRYWTKGGTLRNIPVGGGCRKNKKVSNKKGSDQQCNNNNNNNQNHIGSSHNPNDFELSYLNNTIANQGTLGNSTSYMENYPSRPIDFMESKWENIDGSYRSNYNYFMGNSQDDIGMVNGLGDHNIGHHGLPLNFHGFCSPYGINSFETGQNLMLPYHDQVSEDQNGIDIKPNPKLLSLEWQGQGGCDGGKDTFGHYVNNLGSSWNGIMNNYGPSTTNSLV